MTARLARQIAAALAIVACGLSGCGDDDGDGDGRATAPVGTGTAAQTQTTAQASSEETADAVREVRAALEAAGLKVVEQEVSGFAEALLNVGDTDVTFYKDAAGADADAAVVRRVAEEHPERGRLRVEGRRVYFARRSPQLTKESLDEFRKVIATSEAALRR